MLSQATHEASYIPDPFVKKIEMKLYICFQAIDNIIREGKNHIAEYLIKNPTLIDELDRPSYRKLAKKDKLLVDFYENIYQLRREAYCIENRIIEPAKKHSPSIKYINLRKKIFQENPFLADPDVSQYLFDKNNKEAHFILYNVVLLLLAAFNTNESTLLNHFLQSSLAQQTDNNNLQQDDVAVLGYLIHQHDPDSSEIKGHLSNDYSDIPNKLIKIQFILSIPGVPPEKIRQIEDLVKTPLKFASSVSFGIIQLINYKFLKAFYDHIDVTPDITITERNTINSLSKQLAQANYIFSSKESPTEMKYHDNILLLRNKTTCLIDQYGINDQKSVLGKEYAFISYRYLRFVKINLSDLKKTSQVISKEDPICNLILDGNIANLSENEQKEVCENIIHIEHSLLNLDAFQARIDSFICQLFLKNNIAAFRFIFPPIIRSSTRKDAKKYKNLLSACEFYLALEEILGDASFADQKNVDNFKKLTQKIQDDQFCFEKIVFSKNLAELNFFIKTQFVDYIIKLQSDMEKHKVGFYNNAALNSFKNKASEFAVLLGENKKEFDLKLNFKLMAVAPESKKTKAPKKSTPPVITATQTNTTPPTETEETKETKEITAPPPENDIPKLMPTESKDSPFTPGPALINFELLIDKYLEAIDLNVSTLQHTAPVYTTHVNIDDFSDENDPHNQNVIEFYKLFFRLLIIKDYTDFESFEKLQNDTNQCLLKIKDESKNAWEYLLNGTRGTGCRSIYRLFMLRLIVHEDSTDVKLFDAVLTHTHAKDLRVFLNYCKVTICDDDADTTNSLIIAQKDLSGFFKSKSKTALTSKPLNLNSGPHSPIAAPLCYIKNCFMALFLLSIPDNENDLSKVREIIKKLTRAGYFIEYPDTAADKTSKHFLFIVMQFIKSIKSHGYHYYSIDDKTQNSNKSMLNAVTLRYVCFLNNCNINDPSISADIIENLKGCIYYILQNKVVIPNHRIEMFWNCVIKIIFKNHAVPTEFIAEINNLVFEIFFKDEKKIKSALEVIKSHTLTAPHQKQFSALLSACEFFYEPSLDGSPDSKADNAMFMQMIKKQKKYNFSALTEYFKTACTQSFRIQFKAEFLKKIENLKSHANIEYLSDNGSRPFLHFQKNVLDLAEKLGIDAEERTILEAKLCYKTPSVVEHTEQAALSSTKKNRNHKKHIPTSTQTDQSIHNPGQTIALEAISENDVSVVVADKNILPETSIKISVTIKSPVITPDIANPQPEAEFEKFSISEPDFTSAPTGNSEKIEPVQESAPGITQNPITAETIDPAAKPITESQSVESHENITVISIQPAQENTPDITQNSITAETIDPAAKPITESQSVESPEKMTVISQISINTSMSESASEQKIELKITQACHSSSAQSSVSTEVASTPAQPVYRPTTVLKTELPESIIYLSLEVYKITGRPLVLLGGALVYLLKKIHKNPNDYDFGIFSELHTFYNIWSKFHPCKIIGEKSAHPVIRAQLFENLNQNIDTDLSFYTHEGDPMNLDNTLKKILSTRDFKISALAMVLYPNADSFEIIGFNGAIESVCVNLISYVYANIFVDDLTRLFRLVKIHIKHPEFKPDSSLAALVNSLSSTSIATFKAFIEHGGLPQIGTRLDELFSKYDTYLVLEWFCKLPIITGMTKIFDHQSISDTAQHFKDYLDTVPDNDKKQAFYYFMYIHLCCRGMQNDPNIISLFKSIEATLEPYYEAPQFRMNLAFINGNSPHFHITSKNNSDQAFVSMVFKTKSYFQPNTDDESSYSYAPQLPANATMHPPPTPNFTNNSSGSSQRPMTPQSFSNMRTSNHTNAFFSSTLRPLPLLLPQGQTPGYANVQARTQPRPSQPTPPQGQSQQKRARQTRDRHTQSNESKQFRILQRNQSRG